MLYECVEACTGGLILVEADRLKDALDKARERSGCPLVECKPFGRCW